MTDSHSPSSRLRRVRTVFNTREIPSIRLYRKCPVTLGRVSPLSDTDVFAGYSRTAAYRLKVLCDVSHPRGGRTSKDGRKLTAKKFNCRYKQCSPTFVSVSEFLKRWSAFTSLLVEKIGKLLLKTEIFHSVDNTGLLQKNIQKYYTYKYV